MKILGIQKHSLSSVCIFDNYDLIYYNQEERLSKIKREGGFPLECLKQAFTICKHFDMIIFTGYNFSDVENKQLLKIIKETMGVTYTDYREFAKPHHLAHASKAFFNSGFDEATTVVWDGRGSNFTLSDGTTSYETTSVFQMEYPCKTKLVYKRLFALENISSSKVIPKKEDLDAVGKYVINDADDQNTIYDIRNDDDIGHMYAHTSDFIGLGFDESGKMMGLQSYGKENKNLPNIVHRINEKYISNCAYMNHPLLSPAEENRQHVIDFCSHVQKQLEIVGLDLIQRMLDITKCKNLVITGGVALNILANSFYRKHLPNDINIYVEPLCGDEGNCIGACLYYLQQTLKQDIVIPFKNLYLGPKPTYDFKLNSGEKLIDVTNKTVAEMLAQGNIIALFHGSAEAGPRALGNRSILFDPRVKNGKDIVNTVKNREWFRPFACAVIAEYCSDWFEMNGLNESPYMMYALTVKENKGSLIPSVIHVDNTCRVQTITAEQNKNLYNLLHEFNKLTDIPILLNTSFNLAGNPLVETTEDALETLRNSNIEYLYLADLQKMVIIENVSQSKHKSCHV
jgi:carbamoyltransferase